MPSTGCSCESESPPNEATRSISSPVGPLIALATRRGLAALQFGRQGAFGGFNSGDYDGLESRVLDQTQTWLEKYFAGAFGDLMLPPLDLRGTEFELLVWQELLQIPLGSTWTYGAIAQRLGDPGAARAVGLANGRNPIAILVPCHRVIGSGGKLVGYGGGLERKRFLLEHEGAISGPLPF